MTLLPHFDDLVECPLCGEAFELDVLEWWPADRAFLLWACCEDIHEEAAAALRDGPRRDVAEWFRQHGVTCRQTYADLDCLHVDPGLELGPVELKEAKAFVRAHHAHVGEDGEQHPPCGWRWGHGVRNGGDLVAVAMVGRPVARLLDDGTRVEVNRVCVRRDVPAALTWNACSMLYGAAAREAKRRRFETVLTYTLEDEAGTTLRAAGYVPVATTRGGPWGRKDRPRAVNAPTCRKVRWERSLAS